MQWLEQWETVGQREVCECSCGDVVGCFFDFVQLLLFLCFVTQEVTMNRKNIMDRKWLRVKTGSGCPAPAPPPAYNQVCVCEEGTSQCNHSRHRASELQLQLFAGMLTRTHAHTHTYTTVSYITTVSPTQQSYYIRTMYVCRLHTVTFF